MIRKRYVLPASTVTFSWVQPAHTATQTRGGECGAAINLVQPARCTQTTSHYQHGEGGGGSPAAAIAADQYMLWYAPGRWCAPCGQAGRQAGKRASRQAGKQASGQAGWKVVGRNRRMHTCQPSPPDYTPLPPLTLPPYCKHPPHAHPPGLVALAQGCAALLPGATQYWLTTPLQLGCRQSP